MNINYQNLNEKNIESLVISENLYYRLKKYTHENKLATTTYNHGKGVDRIYTLNYCLQHNQKGYMCFGKMRLHDKYILKRGGSSPTKYSGLYIARPERGELEKLTPSFDTLCRNIAIKTPQDVFFVNRTDR